MNRAAHHGIKLSVPGEIARDAPKSKLIRFFRFASVPAAQFVQHPLHVEFRGFSGSDIIGDQLLGISRKDNPDLLSVRHQILNAVGIIPVIAVRQKHRPVSHARQGRSGRRQHHQDRQDYAQDSFHSFSPVFQSCLSLPRIRIHPECIPSRDGFSSLHSPGWPAASPS